MFDFEQWQKQFNKEVKISKALPDGVVVGKLFTLPVADGEAVYQVAKVNKTTVKIVWRKDLTLDEYMDNILGDGGSFPKKIIKNIIERTEVFEKRFSQC